MIIPKAFIFVAGSAIMAVFGLLMGWFIFPSVLKSMLRKQMALTKDTDVRKMWEYLPFPMDYKIYLFNYTNPEEVQNGGIPIVNEIGPYYFEEWREKVDIEESDVNDTLTYKNLDTFYFRRDLSGDGLTGEEVITMPNIFLLGTVASILRDKPAMLAVIGKALNGILDNPTDVFVRIKALDMLFRGTIINCDRTEFAPKAVCSSLKKDTPPGFVLEPNSQFRFSLFGAKNGTVDPKIITVNRGKNNVLKVGSMVAINGDTKQNIWRDSCDEFDGTDCTVFPPFLSKTERVLAFIINVCRPFRPVYQYKTNYHGITAYHYFTTIGDLANDPELNCYCDTPDSCLPKGLMDLLKCVNAPLYASMPHFFDADPKVQEKINGIHPNANLHGIEADFEPISGTPLIVRKRLQFNIQLIKAEKYDLTKKLSGDIAPLFWIEEGFDLNKTFVDMLKHQLFLPKRIVNVLRWFMVSFGIIGVFAGTLFHFRDRIIKVSKSGDKVSKITPEAAEDDEGKNISVIGEPQMPAKIDM